MTVLQDLLPYIFVDNGRYHFWFGGKRYSGPVVSKHRHTIEAGQEHALNYLYQSKRIQLPTVHIDKKLGTYMFDYNGRIYNSPIRFFPCHLAWTEGMKHLASIYEPTEAEITLVKELFREHATTRDFA
jgi:hypothetical protein